MSTHHVDAQIDFEAPLGLVHFSFNYHPDGLTKISITEAWKFMPTFTGAAGRAFCAVLERHDFVPWQFEMLLSDPSVEEDLIFAAKEDLAERRAQRAPSHYYEAAE